MTIRNATAEDAAACCAIYNYYITNTCISFEERVLTSEEFKNRMERISERYPYIVATDGDIAGYAYLDMFHTRSAYRYTADLSIYLDPKYTHAGIGSLLYAEIEKQAVSRGIKNIISLITANNDASVKFHEKHGFKQVGELVNVGFKHGKRLSVKYYQKELETK